MVQNISVQNSNQMGTVNRIASTTDGRIVYQVTSSDGSPAGKMVVAGKDADTFERAYQDIVETAPQIQEFAQRHSSPEEVARLKKRSNWTVGIATALGFIIPAATTSKLKPWLQITLSALGALVGYIGGSAVSYSMNTPSGMAKFTKASQVISNMDIQLVPEQVQTLQAR